MGPFKRLLTLDRLSNREINDHCKKGKLYDDGDGLFELFFLVHHRMRKIIAQYFKLSFETRIIFLKILLHFRRTDSAE